MHRDQDPGHRTTVSVIMPTYNFGRFIAESIDSILGQTLPPEQIIIVDDGSTDGTEHIVRRYNDPRIEYIKKANGGVSSARNAGLAAARCEFVTFLDADDRWRPTYVEEMRELMLVNKNAVCSFANFVRFDHATGETLRDQFQYYPAELRHWPGNGIPQDNAFSLLVGFGEIPAFTFVMMFRRSLIDDLFFDEELAICEDIHFVLRAFMRGDVMLTSRILCEVRRHDSNATRQHHTIAVHKLAALKALGPFVTDIHNQVAYRDRLVKASIDAAIYQTQSGNVRTGLRYFWDGVNVPNSPLRKIKGAIRIAMALPRGIRAEA